MENRAAAWTLIGVVVGFKAWAVLLIFLMAPTGEAVHFLIAMNWPILVGLAVLVALPATFWLRLVRTRSRRRQLVWEEWHPEEGRPSGQEPTRRRS